jgi:tetratricopeptide (TPR) repeat protein
MDTIRVAGGSLGQFLGRDDLSDPETVRNRILQLSSGMMILGTVRFICAFGDYATSYLETSRSSLSWRVLSRFLQENPPAVVLGFAWPLALGIILQRTGRGIFLKAAAVTFLVMSVGGIVAMITGLTLRSDWQVFFGSFHVPRGMLSSPRPAAVARAIMGSAQLLLEFGTAAWAWTLSRQLRGLPEAEGSGPSSGSSRNLLQGRLALYISLGFLFLNVRLPFWSAYLEVLNRSRLVREFILENDTRHHVPYRTAIVDSPAARRAVELDMVLSSALRHVASNQYAEARDEYLRIIAQAQLPGPDAVHGDEGNFHLARAFNNLGWLLATCADETFRDSDKALTYAKRAVEISPDEGTYWNTLGVAQYRAGNWEEAMKALDRSMELRDQGDSFDWYFVAMVQAKMVQTEQARQWYDKAVAWNEETQPGEEELHRFRGEATEVLGLPEPPPLVRAPKGPVLDEKRIAPGSFSRRLRSKNITGPMGGPSTRPIE